METPLRRSSRRMKSQDSSESATKQQDEGNVTLGPRSMAKLRKAAAKLNESKAIDMNKTAPAQVIVEAQNIRKKRSRSVTHENVKREKLEEPEKTAEVPHTNTKSQSGRQGRSSTRKSSTSRARSITSTSSDSSPTEESQKLTNKSTTAAAAETAPETQVTQSTEPAPMAIKEEPVSFKTEMSSSDENLEDISLIDLTDVPTPPVSAAVTLPIGTESVTAKRNSFVDLMKTAEIEASIEDIEAPNFDISAVMKTPKSMKTEQISCESLQEMPTTPAATAAVLSDTFSPVVDATINDSRPNIDSQSLSIVEPVIAAVKSLASRTSTPFASKFAPSKNMSSAKKRATTANDSIAINPLEKSILKSSRRKRSMSVHDLIDEHVASKRVMFISPQFMEIEKIDEKMMASFICEKENSILQSNPRARRSQSAGPPSERKIAKVPDFKAIHERNFNKMESIGDHMKRKAERAKKLFTPEAKKPEVKASRIPKVATIKPLPAVEVVKPKVEPNTVPEPKKAVTPKRVPFTSASQQLAKPIVKPKLELTKSPAVKKFSGISAAVKKPVMSNFEANRIKVEERRERNMALYKTNHVQRATSDAREKNKNLLKGVRLNRRFELQMKQRQNSASHDAE